MTLTTKEQIAFSNAGLVNNKSVCIKDMGSTFACVCEPCLKEGYKKMQDRLNENLKN